MVAVGADKEIHGDRREGMVSMEVVVGLVSDAPARLHIREDPSRAQDHSVIIFRTAPTCDDSLRVRVAVKYEIGILNEGDCDVHIRDRLVIISVDDAFQRHGVNNVLVGKERSDKWYLVERDAI